MKQPTRQQLRRHLAALEAAQQETITRRQCQDVLDAIYEAQRQGSAGPLTAVQHLLEGVLG